MLQILPLLMNSGIMNSGMMQSDIRGATANEKTSFKRRFLRFVCAFVLNFENDRLMRSSSSKKLAQKFFFF